MTAPLVSMEQLAPSAAITTVRAACVAVAAAAVSAETDECGEACIQYRLALDELYEIEARVCAVQLVLARRWLARNQERGYA